MKKLLTSLVLFALVLSTSISLAQTTHPVELGFNVGASWLQSDVKMKKLGGAGGLTLGQMYGQNDKNALDWGWRFRYLNAVAYGQDTKKSTGIANNPVLNGYYDTTVSYSNTGFVYQNYKTKLDELSLELVIGANQMRNKTKVYPYIFGGIGITKAATKTNLLDDAGMRYNYFAVDSNGTGTGSQITTSLNNMYDGSYETAAEGSESTRWKFMPSLGVGLGYQFTPGFSMGLEHKMTWALNDGLDGQQWNNDNTFSATKDKYHYSSVWLKFSFGRTSHHSTIDTNTNTNVNTNTNIVTPAGDKPTVMITNPSSTSYTSTSQSYTVRATIKNVASKSDIGLVYNGVSNTNFTYDATTQTFAFPLMLLNGSNTFMITATNANGSTTDNATVLFESPVNIPPAAPAPVVTITSPTTNPFSTTSNNATVLASILNVTSASQIGVTINGVATSSFLFSPSTHMLNVNSNLNPGANTFVISATNPSGSDSKSETVIYSLANPTPPPVVTYINPAVNPFTSTVASLPINAMVQNVTSVGQIAVTLNGNMVPTSMLAFNPSTAQLNFSANLMAGANSVNISATNAAGADAKAITIIYNQPVVPVAPAPVVSITSPTVNPFNTSSNLATVNAIVLNVTSPSQINVTFNGVGSSAFTYNMSTKQLSFNMTLIAGANIVTVAATTPSGSDSKSATLIYNQPAAMPAPTVTITSPAVNPFNTPVNTAVVNATVLNVLSSSQIAVSLNGTLTSSFTYNVGTKQLTFNASLISGANIVTISATTPSGSDSKSETIIYTQPVASPAPVVTIVSPNVNPYNSAVASLPINALVQNVSSIGQISVTLNGGPVGTSLLSFNASTGQLNFNANLIAGANSLIVSATNAVGADSKTITIIYTPVVAANPAPVVTITSPSVNPFNTSVSSATVNATVLNVSSSSEINATVNGVTVPFTYNMSTKQLVLTTSLIAGANTVTISATTPTGSDSKTKTIMYTAVVAATPAPVVTITSPTVNPFNTSTATCTVTATVLNVTSSSEITSTINGGTVPFTYNMATKQLSLTTTLIAGGNIVTIAATTPTGSDSKTATIIYTAPVVIPAPIVTFTTPLAPGAGSTTAVYNVEATVLNVLASSAINVKVNGVNLSAFAFNASTKQVKFNATLISGANTVTITATNASGTDTKSVVIKYRPTTIGIITPDTTANPANPGNPNIHNNTATPRGGGGAVVIGGGAPTITLGIANPYNTTVALVPVTAVVDGITMQSDVVVKVNGAVVPFNFMVKTKTVSFDVNANVGANIVTITATNTSGVKTETLMITRP